MDECFSLLMAVYSGDQAPYLRRAFRSSVDEQVLRPSEVVIVQDGPLSRNLEETLAELIDTCPVPAKLKVLPRNLGLAAAMEAGLAACTYDVVARMDADDVSLPNRFARTVPLLHEGADLVGSSLLEIAEDERVVLGRRDPPTSPNVISAAARWHDPFNHPSVVYRRTAVEAAGGYQCLPMLEDYWLFARMILNGARVANVPEPLVLYRVSDGAYRRRGGIPLLRAEVRLQTAFLRCGFTTPRQFVRNVLCRGGYRVVPEAVRRPVYRLFIASRGVRLEARSNA